MKLALTKRDWLFAILMIALGTMQAVSYRFTSYSADDCSYLDQAAFFQRFDFQHGVTSYWSPLYPLIVGLIFAVANPARADQLFAIKLVNVGILAFLLFAFFVFLKQFCATYATRFNTTRLSETQIHLVAYVLFAWGFLALGSMQQATPDQLVAAFLFLAVATVLNINKTYSPLQFAFLGVALGFGYLAKAVMIPPAVILVLLAMFKTAGLRKRIAGGLIAAATFALVSSPYVACLSATKGSFNMGSSASLNYMMTINPLYENIKYDESLIPELEHPVRYLQKQPHVIEFDRNIDVTFPPWFDPGYFAEGLKLRFDWLATIVNLVVNLLFAFYICGWQLFAGYIAGIIAARKPYFPAIKDSVDFAALWLPTLATIVSLCLVISLPTGMTTPRYFAPFIVLGYLSFFAVMNFDSLKKSQLAIKTAATTTCAIAALLLSISLFKDVSHLVTEQTDRVGLVTAELKKLGIKSGDKAAFMGLEDFEWARRLNVHVIAENTSIPPLKPGEHTAVLNRIMEPLKKTDADFIIYFSEPISEHQINETNYVIDLRRFIAGLLGKEYVDDVTPPKFDQHALAGWSKLGEFDAYVLFLKPRSSGGKSTQ